MKPHLYRRSPLWIVRCNGIAVVAGSFAAACAIAAIEWYVNVR